MDAATLEARFLDQAKRGTAHWRRRQRWSLHVAVFGGLFLPGALLDLARADDASTVLGPTIQSLVGLTLLAYGLGSWSTPA